MATIRKHRDKWQAQVRRIGRAPISKSFHKKEDALRWARECERAMDLGSALEGFSRPMAKHTLEELFDRYLREVSPRKRSESDRYHIAALRGSPLGRAALAHLRASEVASYRDRRLTEVGPATVRKELALLGHVLKVASQEWGLSAPEGLMGKVRKPSSPPGRTRRLSPDELKALEAALTSTRNREVPSVIRFALATGMRRSEVLKLRWADIDLTRRVAQLHETKNGEPRSVPLSPQALSVLQAIGPKASTQAVFSVTANALRLAWERLKRRAKLDDLRFHDLRHEAISRFFELGLSVPEVSLISGHKDSRMLFRYTHLKPENVALRLVNTPEPMSADQVSVLDGASRHQQA